MEHIDINAGNDEFRKAFRHISESKLGLLRGLSFGAAGFLAANILLLAQVGAAQTSLDVSLFASAIALPLWVATAALYEVYIFRGKRSYGHFKSDFTINLTSIIEFPAAVGLVVATTSIIWYLSVVAAICFLVSCVAAICLLFYHDSNLKKYLEASNRDKT